MSSLQEDDGENMTQYFAFEEERLFCKFCKGMALIDIPKNIDLSSPTSEEFVRNARCTICKNIGYLRR